MTYYKKNILKLPNKQLRNFVSYRLSIILPKRKKKKTYLNVVDPTPTTLFSKLRIL